MAVHHHCPVSTKGFTLFRIGVYVDPHLFRGDILYYHLALCNFFGYEKVYHFDVLGVLVTRELSVFLKQDGALVILEDRHMGHFVSLGLNKIQAPEYSEYGVVNSNQL